ncbi:hypothetical protein K440DRAFT_175934 [Wilcoxina mikolae CBS 423.85]|nr:hypothetical protein K440DRAFT_175934 [Wilcoxina mikolae CBS 423.85]
MGWFTFAFWYPPHLLYFLFYLPPPPLFPSHSLEFFSFCICNLTMFILSTFFFAPVVFFAFSRPVSCNRLLHFFLSAISCTEQEFHEVAGL